MIGAVFLAASTFGAQAVAQSPARPSAQQPGPADQPRPAAPGTPQATPGGETGAKASEQGSAGIWQRANLFGDLGGVRTGLADQGVTFGLTEISEVLGNVSGGVRHGAAYEGLTQMSVGFDTEKLFGLLGGTLNATAYQIHGRGLSLNNLGNNLNTVSSLEAARGTLLFELWYEQILFNRTIGIRVGQLAADQEFMISQYGGLFINHTFAWSTFPSTNLPSGGPAYPLATPGVRVRWTPRGDLALLIGVFNGDPAGPGRGLPQNRDSSGTAFRLSDGVFAIAEAQYSTNTGESAAGLPGIFKAGAYFDTQNFADQRRNASGASLADASGAAAVGRNRRGSYGLYAQADQLLYRSPGTKDQGLGAFVRVMGAPGDRNLVNFYLDSGVTFKGAVPGRDSDTTGIAFAIARISDTAAKLDSDTAIALGSRYPVRRHESVLELTYQAQLAPWWQVQPSAQYIFNPNGGVPDPRRPGKRLGDAAVFGARTTITF